MRDDGAFERWLEDRLDTHLGVHAAGPAPRRPRYRTARPRFALTPLRLGVAVAAALAAIGGGAAYAAGLVHGPSVSHAASSCAGRADAGHTGCVSTAAQAAAGSGSGGASAAHRSSGTAGSAAGGGDTHGDDVANAAHTCPKSPPGAHGECVSSTASGGRSERHDSHKH
ncbi:MAG TPA: hypothetical protein VF155_09830 [Candidatus Dormibacteraeota bacterium]